jgi:endonuclease/exonuclease/phosphatase family metal-dependent hydrolase
MLAAPIQHDDDADELHHPELAIWRANVGAPVVLDLAPPLEGPVRSFDLLSWNLAIGDARLGDVLARLRRRGLGTSNRPLVVLAQEAYREDDTVPRRPGSRHHGGKAGGAGRADIARIAHSEGLSLRYAPSMRNGAHASDRGNAVLASAAIGATHAFLLPYVRQRRVVITAELKGLEGLWLTSAHLDTGGQLRDRSRVGRFGAGRVAQIDALAERVRTLGGDVIIGADLNTPLGRRDPAVSALVRAGYHPAIREHQWRHTFHGPLRLLLDHTFWRSDNRIESVHVERIDETAADRGARVFGSDHHPLLAHVTLSSRALERRT